MPVLIPVQFIYYRRSHFQRLLMHLVRPNNRQGSQARILRKADPIFGDTNFHRGVSQYFNHCIHLGQAKAPNGSRIGCLLYCHHGIHHPPKPRARLGQRTIRSSVSHRLRLLRCAARSLDPSFEQYLRILQDSLRHGYGNWSGQRWWIRCIALLPGESSSVLLVRLQDHLLADVHGDWLHRPLCSWTLVREQAKARWEEGSSAR